MSFSLLSTASSSSSCRVEFPHRRWTDAWYANCCIAPLKCVFYSHFYCSRFGADELNIQFSSTFRSFICDLKNNAKSSNKRLRHIHFHSHANSKRFRIHNAVCQFHFHRFQFRLDFSTPTPNETRVIFSINSVFVEAAVADGRGNVRREVSFAAIRNRRQQRISPFSLVFFYGERNLCWFFLFRDSHAIATESAKKHISARCGKK